MVSYLFGQHCWDILYMQKKKKCVTMREACRAIRYTVQPFATFSSCSLMTTWTSADREDWLATKITVAKETWNEQSMKCTFNQKKILKKKNQRRSLGSHSHSPEAPAACQWRNDWPLCTGPLNLPACHGLTPAGGWRWQPNCGTRERERSHKTSGVGQAGTPQPIGWDGVDFSTV